MILPGNGSSPVPDGPPLVCIARCGDTLHVTVLHAATADILWQLRQDLAAVYRCSDLQLTILDPSVGDGEALTIQWKRPLVPDASISPRRP